MLETPITSGKTDNYFHSSKPILKTRRANTAPSNALFAMLTAPLRIFNPKLIAVIR